LVSRRFSDRNPATAWEWFEKGVAAGIKTAVLNQATFLKRGENGEVEYQKAFGLLESLVRGDPDKTAAYLLALLILSGECQVKDQSIARNYLEISAEKGCLPAAKLLDNNELFSGPAVLNFWEDYIVEDLEE